MTCGIGRITTACTARRRSEVSRSLISHTPVGSCTEAGGVQKGPPEGGPKGRASNVSTTRMPAQQLGDVEYGEGAARSRPSAAAMAWARVMTESRWRSIRLGWGYLVCNSTLRKPCGRPPSGGTLLARVATGHCCRIHQS